MGTEEMQMKYDLLLTNIAALPLVVGLFVRMFYETPLTATALSLLSAIGLVFLLGYLLAVGWFLELCNKDNDAKANVISIIAKCCQHGLVVLSSIVIILLAVM